MSSYDLASLLTDKIRKFAVEVIKYCYAQAKRFDVLKRLQVFVFCVEEGLGPLAHRVFSDPELREIIATLTGLSVSNVSPRRAAEELTPEERQMIRQAVRTRFSTLPY